MTPITLNRQPSIRFIAGAVVAVAALAWHGAILAQAAPSAAPAQSSSERGVTVKVTPRPVPQGAAEWEFSVVLDTHSEDLGDDLLKTAVLLADGREIKPSQWVGGAPGGHHREGVLKFPAPEPAATSIEIRIQRGNEAAARVFRWDAAALR